MQLSQSDSSERGRELVALQLAKESASAKSRAVSSELSSEKKKMPRDDNDDERSRKLFVGGLAQEVAESDLQVRLIRQ